MSDTTLAWHFLLDNHTLRFSHNNKLAVKVCVGQTLQYDGHLELCRSGLHASIRLIDALKYAPGATICRVECGGKILRGNDKICAETRKVLWMLNGTRLLHEFACDVAELALAKMKNPDPRSVAAIKAKRDWLVGKITDAELAAIQHDAWIAWNSQEANGEARNVAGAAWYATWHTNLTLGCSSWMTAILTSAFTTTIAVADINPTIITSLDELLTARVVIEAVRIGLIDSGQTR